MTSYLKVSHQDLPRCDGDRGTLCEGAGSSASDGARKAGLGDRAVACQGVGQDDVSAYMWFNLAAANGFN